MAENQVNRKIRVGTVTSDKMEKTITVKIETVKQHPLYKKIIKTSKQYKVHDENNEAKNGDTVTIMETRKLSATKRFRLVSVDKKAELTVKEAEAELKAEVLAAEEEKKEDAE